MGGNVTPLQRLTFEEAETIHELVGWKGNDGLAERHWHQIILFLEGEAQQPHTYEFRNVQHLIEWLKA